MRRLAAILLALAALAATGIGHPPPCQANAYCTPVMCISSAGCISPCVCAKQQGEAYGECVSVELVESQGLEVVP